MNIKGISCSWCKEMGAKDRKRGGTKSQGGILEEDERIGNNSVRILCKTVLE